MKNEGDKDGADLVVELRRYRLGKLVPSLAVRDALLLSRHKLVDANINAVITLQRLLPCHPRSPLNDDMILQLYGLCELQDILSLSQVCRS